MDQNGDGKAAETRAAEFLRQHHRAQIIHFRAAEVRRIAQPQKAEFPHLAQHLARHVTLALPGLAIRLDLFTDEPSDLIAQERMLLAQVR